MDEVESQRWLQGIGEIQSQLADVGRNIDGDQIGPLEGHVVLRLQSVWRSALSHLVTDYQAMPPSQLAQLLEAASNGLSVLRDVARGTPGEHPPLTASSNVRRAHDNSSNY